VRLISELSRFWQYSQGDRYPYRVNMLMRGIEKFSRFFLRVVTGCLSLKERVGLCVADADQGSSSGGGAARA
jgi:hypothetical protein